jgi:hypothetical protein
MKYTIPLVIFLATITLVALREEHERYCDKMFYRALLEHRGLPIACRKN